MNIFDPKKPVSEFNGQYRYLPTGEVFSLKIVEKSQCRMNRTHLAKGTDAFWDGEPADFQRLFERI